MKAIAERTTLVLAGAFNPAILVPQWVAVHGLGYTPNDQFQVEMLAPILGGGQSRYTFDGLSYSAGFRNVTFHLDDTNPIQAQRAITTAASILEKLPHTPISGLGINFAFLVTEPLPAMLAFMTDHEAMTETFSDETEVVTRGWGNTLKWESALVNFECEVAGGQATIAINFHYSTDSAAQAVDILRDANAFDKHQIRAIEAAKAFTQQNLET